MRETTRTDERFDLRTLLTITLGGILFVGLSVESRAGEVQLPLAYNFNGMVHTGEEGQPDAVDGFRSISDRALIIPGMPAPFADITSAASGLGYDLVDLAGELDILHIGNRNTVDGGNWAFDAAPNADDIGIQPDWLADPDQTTVSNPVNPGIELDGMSRVGIVYQISNGGGDFDVTLAFSDLSSITVTLNGPDWFGPFGGTPGPPGLGVSLQENLGTDFPGSENVDSGDPGATLILTEAVISATDLLADLAFDVDGKTLTDFTFGNRSNTNAGYAVIAVTVVSTDEPVIEVPTAGSAGLIALCVFLALAGSLLLWRASSYGRRRS